MVRHPQLNSPYPDDDDDAIDEQESADDLIQCPGCREMVYEDADRCPYCGQWLPAAKKGGLPRWAVITGWIILACWLIPLAYLLIWAMLEHK